MGITSEKESDVVQSETSDHYFIHGSEVPCTHKYLCEPVYRTLKSIGARKVLDIGCGNGHLDEVLVRRGVEIVGMDPSDDGIRNARKSLPGTMFYHLGVYDDPRKIRESDFDAVISTEVIEHLYYPRRLLQFAKAKLKPGGALIITTPYHGYLKNLALTAVTKWDYHHAPLWDGGHIKFWSRKTLSELLRQEGFTVRKFTGIGRFPYLWRHMLLCCQIEH